MSKPASLLFDCSGIQLSGYWLEHGSPPLDQRAGLVLGFAAVPEGQIASALALLRQAWLAN